MMPWGLYMLDDLLAWAAGRGLGTVGTDLFGSYLPASPQAAIAILETGGPQPNKELPIKKPTFQVMIRSADYPTGRAKLAAARSIFHGLNSQLMGSTFFFYIEAISEGGHLGRDTQGADLFSINFLCETR